MQKITVILAVTASACGVGERLGTGPDDRPSISDAGAVDATSEVPHDVRVEPSLDDLPLDELLDIWCENTNECRQYFSCDNIEPNFTLRAHDERACRELYALDHRECSLPDEVANGELIANRDVLQYCIENERFCDNCPGALVAGRTLDEPCYRDEHCTGDLYCYFGPDGCSTCQELIAPGELCTDGKRCAPPARCAMDGCILPLAVGQSCQVDWQCEETAYCDSTDDICKERAGDGEDCSEADCVSGTSCHASVCRRPREEGEECLGEWDCVEQLWCDEGICREGADEGEDCGQLDDPVWCKPGLGCYGKQCIRAFYIGSGCRQGDNCYSFYASCRNDVCRLEPLLGDACEEGQCREGVCEGGLCVALRDSNTCR